jgi:DNA-binding Lrp family transcriptional regulator
VAEEHTVLSRLPRTPRVSEVSAHCVLNVFFGGPGSLVHKRYPELAARLEPLRMPGYDPAAAPVELTGDDGRLLRVLGQDGRAGFRALAAATGWSQTTVRRRLAELREIGALYFDVEFELGLLGLHTGASLWLSVAPGDLVAAGTALAEHPEVGFVAATTGPSNLYAGVMCPSSRALYDYLTGPVAALPGLHAVETAPIMRILKKTSPVVG